MQQALEKILKALYIKKYNKAPIKSHNLRYLSHKASINLGKETMRLFKELSSYYVRARYASNFNIIKNKARFLYDEGRRVYLWLKEHVLMK